MAMAIKSFVDLKTLTIEELRGRLLIVEESYDLDDVGSSVEKLLLAEEEWTSRQHQRMQGASSGGEKGRKTAYKPK